MAEERSRPKRYVNELRLILERGDGECIDLGVLPQRLDSFIDVVELLVKITAATKRCGNYDPYLQTGWTPQQLDFNVNEESNES